MYNHYKREYTNRTALEKNISKHLPYIHRYPSSCPG
jgi:hypothetical protein